MPLLIYLNWLFRLIKINKFTFSKRTISLYLFLFFLVFGLQGFAQKTWDAGGDGTSWSSAGNWNPNGVPAAGETVTISNNGSRTINVDGNYTCSSLTINYTGNTNGTISINIIGANSLTTGAISLSNSATNGGSDINLNVADGNIICSNISFTQSSHDASDNFVTINTGNLNCTGNISMGASNLRNYLLFTGAGTLNIGGTITGGTITSSAGGGAFWPTSGTVNYNNAGAQNIGAYTYYNLTTSGSGVKTMAGNVTVNNILTINNNTTFADAGFTLSSAGTLNLNSGGTLKLGAATATTWPAFSTNNIASGSTVEYAANAAQVISVVPGYHHLTFSGTGVKTPPAGTLTIGGNWTVAGGNSALNTNNTSATVTGNIAGTGNIVSGSGTITLSGDFSNSGTFTCNTGTVTYAGTNQQVKATTYNNLTFSGGGNKTLAGAVIVNTGLTLNSGLVLLGNNNITLGQSAIVGGTPSVTAMVVTNSTGKFVKTFAADNTPAFTFPIGEITGTTEYSPFTIDFSSTSGAAGGTVGVLVTDATHGSNAPATNYISRYWSLTTTGLANYIYTTSLTYLPADINGSESSMSLNVRNAGAWLEDANSFAGSNQLVSGTLTQATGPLNNSDFTGRNNNPTNLYYRTKASNNWSNTATWEVSTDPAFIAPGPSAATTTPTSSNSLGITILNTHTVTVTANVAADDFTIAAGGKLIVNSGVTFTVANGAGTDMTVNGTVDNAGTITPTGTIAFNAGSTYNHTGNGGAIPQATWALTSLCNVTGITNSVLSPITTNTTFGKFKWNSLGQTVACDLVSGAVDISIAGDFELLSTNTGSLNLASANFTVQGNSVIDGNLTDTDNTGTNVFQGTVDVNYNDVEFASISFNPGTTTEFRKDVYVYIQSFTPSFSIGNCTFTTNSPITFSSDVNAQITGTLTIASGITVINQGIVTVSGVLNGADATSTFENQGTFYYAYVGQQPMNTGILKSTGSNSVYYSGAGNQQIKITQSGSYSNLIISGSGTKTLQANTTITGNLTVTSGVLDLQTFTADRSAAGGTITIGAAGTLKIDGTGTFPANFTNKSFAAYSAPASPGAIVEYSGSNQNLQVLSYVNLTLSGSGNKVLTGGSDLTVSRLLTIAGTASLNMGTGTLAGGADTGGGLTMTGGTLTLAKIGVTLPEIGGSYSLTGGTIDFAGTNQTVRAATYNNITLSGGGVYHASGNLTANGTLNLFNGILYLDNSDLTIGTSGTISGAFDAAHMVSCTGTGRLQKQFTGTSINFTFPIGTDVIYTPAQINITSCTNGGTGNILIRAVEGKAPSQVDDTYSLNKYWATTTTGISNINATLTFTYDESEADAANEDSYVGAYYNGAWTTYPAGVNSTANTITCTRAAAANLDGNWTAGLNSAFISTTYYTRANGTWEDVNTWSFSCGGASAGSIPSPGDAVVICQGNAVTVNSNVACGSLTLGTSNNATSVTINGNNTVTVNGNLRFNLNNNNSNYNLNVNAGNLIVKGSVVGAGNGTKNINITTGSANFTKTTAWTWGQEVNVYVTGAGSATWDAPLTTSTANTTLSVTGADGSLTFNGFVTQSAGNITAGAGNDGLVNIINFYGGITTSNNNINSSALDIIRFGGNLTNTSGGNLAFYCVNNGICTVEFVNNNSTVTPGLGISFGNVVIGSAVTVTLAGNIKVGGDWTNNNGYLNAATYQVTFDAPGPTGQFINGTSSTVFYDVYFTVGSIYTMEIDNTVNNISFRDNTRGRANSLTLGDGNPTLTVNGNMTIYQPDVAAGGAIVNGLYVNGGTANIAGNVTFYNDGGGAGKTTIIQVSSGDLNIQGAVTFPVNANDAVHVINLNGSGNINFNSTVETAGTPTVFNDGTISLTDLGVINFAQKFNMNGGTLNVSSGGTVNFQKAADAFSFSNGSVASFNTYSGSVIKFNGNLTTTAALTLAPESESYFTGNATITPNTLTLGHVIINPGVSLTLAGNIAVVNNWTNNGGTFIPSTNTVSFTGAYPKIITSAGGTETFYNLTANTTNLITFESNTDVIISNNLNMTAGSFDLNGRTLQLGNGSEANLTRTTGTLFGGTFMRYIASGSGVSSSAGSFDGLFPIGTETDYRPVMINSSSNPTGSGYISVSHTNLSSVSDVAYTDNNGDAIQRVTDMKTTLTTSGGFAGGTYNLDVKFSGLSAVGNTADLKMETVVGPPFGVGAHAATTASVDAPTVSRTGLSDTDLNNSFVVGSKNTTNTPLRRYYYSRKSGNWNDATVGNSTWSFESGGSGTSCNCTPAADDYVVISTGHTVTITAVASADYVEIMTGATLTGTANFTVNKDISTNGSGKFTPTAGTWTVSRNVTLVGTGASSSTGAFNVTGDLNIGAGTSLTLGTNSTVSSDLVVDGTLNLGAINLTLNGAGKNISGSAGASAINGTGSLIINTGAKTILASTILTVNTIFAIQGVLVTNYGTITVNNNITGNGGASAWTNASNSIVNVTGSFLIGGGGGTLTASAIPNTVNYCGAGAQTLKAPSANYYYLKISNAGTKTMNASITVNGSCTIQNNATLEDNGNLLQGPGDLIMTDNSNFNVSRAGIEPRLSGAYNLTGGTINFDRNGNQTVRNIYPQGYYNVNFTNNGTKTLGGNLLVKNNLFISGSAVLEISTSLYSVEVQGNWTVTSTAGDPFRERTSIVSFTGYAPQTISTVLAAGETFYDLVLNNSLGITLDPSLTNLNITNNITIENLSVFNANGRPVNVNGNWINNGGTHNPGNNTTTFRGSLQSISNTGTETFNNLSLINASNVTLGCPVNINGNLSLANTSRLDVSVSNFDVFLKGNWNITSTNADPFVENSGTVTFNGTALQTLTTPLAQETFYNVVFSNNIGGVRLDKPIVTSADLTISLGGKLNANNQNISVKGNWNNNGGTFTPGTNTVTFDGTAMQTITNTSGETFYGLTVNTTGPLTLDQFSPVTVTNTLNLTQGNINLNTSSLTLGNSAAATLVRTNGHFYDGVFKRWLPTAGISSTVAPLYGLFPIGNATEYRPVEINSTANPTAAGYVAAAHTDESSTIEIDPAYVDNEANSISRITAMKSSLTTSGGFAGGTYNLNVTFTGLAGTGNLADLKLETYTGAIMGSAGTSIANAGTVNAPKVGRSGLNASNLANDFVIGTKDPLVTPLRPYFYSRKPGNWTDVTPGDGTWSYTSGGPSCDCVPSGNGYAIISLGHLVTVDAAVAPGSVDYIDIQNGAVLAGTFALTVGKDLTTYGNGIFAPSSGSWTIGRNTILQGTGTSSFAGVSSTVGLNVGENNTLSLGNNFTVAGNMNVDGTFNIGAYQLTVSGAGSVSGSTGAAIINGTGSVRFTSTRSVLSGSNLTIVPNTSINGSYTITNNGSVVFAGNLSATTAAAKWVNAANSILTLGGDILTTGILNASAAPNTVFYNKAGDQGVKIPLSSYYNLTLTNSGTKTFASAGTINVTNMVTLQDAVIFDVSTNTLNGVGGLTMNGTSELRLARSATVPELTGTYNITGGTITLNGAGNQTIRSLNAVPSAYYNLNLANTAIKSLAGAITVQNNLTLSSTAQLDVGASNYMITLGGHWNVTSTNADPFVQRNGTVLFNGIAEQTISTVLAGGETFYNFTVNNPVGVKLNTIISAGNDLTIESGAVLNSNNFNMFVGRNWVNNGGNFLPVTNTVDFNGGAAQLISATTTASFYNIIFSNSNTKLLGCNISVSNALQIRDNAVLDVSASNFGISIAGDWTVTSANANPFIERSGTVTFNGVALQNISTILLAGETFYNFIISNNTSGVRIQNPINVTANLTINAGAFLDANNKDITVAGNWTNNAGNFIPTTGRVTFNGTTTQTITNLTGETFYNVTLNASGILTLDGSSNMKITNNFTMTAGNFDLNGRILTLGDGANASLNRTSGILYGGVLKRYIATGSAITYNSASNLGLFPVGSATEYRPVELESIVAPTASGFVSVSHTDAINVSDVVYIDNEGDPISRITDMYSSISTSGGFSGGTYKVHVTMTSLSPVGLVTDLKLLTYTGLIMGSSGATIVSTGTVQAPRVGRSGVAFANLTNDYVVGTKNVVNTPLKKYYYSRKPGNWNDATPGDATWSFESGGSGTSCDCMPDASGYAVVSSGHTVTITTPAIVDFVDIENAAILNGTANTTINKDLTTFGDGYFAPTAGNWTVNRNVTLNGTGSSSFSGTTNIAGNLTITGDAILTVNSGMNIFVGGDLTVDGNLDIGASTLTLNGVNKSISGSGGDATISGNGTLNVTTGNKSILSTAALTVHPTFAITGARTVTNNGAISISGDLTGTLATSVWTNAAGSTLNIGGALLATGTLNANAANNTVNYNGAGNQLVKMPSSTYFNLNISNAGTKTFASAGTISVTNLVTIQDAAIFDVDANTLNGGGGLNMQGTSELKMKKTGVILPELTGSYNITGGTVTLNALGNQTLRSLNAVPSCYNHLTLMGSGYKTLAGNITVRGNLLLAGTAILDVTVTNYAITLGGNWTVTSTDANPFIERSGTVTCNGNTIQTLSTVLAAGETFYNLTIANTVGVELANETNITNTLTINNGAVFNAQNNNINISGTWNNLGGNFIPGSNTVTFNGTGAQSIFKATGETFNNIVFSNTGTTTLAGPITILGNLTIQNSASFNVGAANFDLTLAGNWNVTSINANPFVEQNGTVAFNGTGVQTISTVLPAGETFYNLLDNNNTGGITLSNPISVTGDFTINTGAIFNANNQNMRIGRNWSNSGTFTPGSNTVTFNGTVPQSIVNTAGEVFNNFVCNATGPITFDPSTNVTITNSFTLTSGNINLNSKMLTLGNGSIASLSYTNGILYGGTFRRYLAAGTPITSNSGSYYGLFPMGTATDYRPIQLNSTSNPTSSGYLSAAHTDNANVIDLSPTYTDNNLDVIERITEMKSSLLASGGFDGGQYSLTISFTGLAPVGSVNDLKMISYTSAIPGSAGAIVPSSGTPAAPTVGKSSLSVSDISNDFVIGTKNPGITPIMQYYYSRKTGDWNDNDPANGTWSLTAGGGPACGCIPGANSYAVISETNTVTVNVPASIGYINIENNAILNGTANFTITKDITTNGTGVFSPSSGTWSVARNVTLTGTGASSFATSTSIGGNLSVGSGTTLTMPLASDLTVTGNLNVDGTLALSTSNLLLNGLNTIISGSAGAALITGTGSVNLTTGNKVFNIGSNLTIAPNVSIGAGRVITNNGTITLQNNLSGASAASKWINGNNSVLNIAGALLTNGILDASATNLVNYNGAGAQTLKVPLSTYYNVTFSNGGVKSFVSSTGNTVTVSNMCIIQDAVILNIEENTLNGTAGLQMSGTSEFRIAKGGVAVPEFTGVYAITSGTVILNRAGNQILRGLASAPSAYYNLVLSNSGIKTLAGNTVIQHDLSIDNTASFDVSASHYSLSIGGDWNVTSTHTNPFVEQLGTVTFNGSDVQGISTVLAGGETFYNLVINNSNAVNLNCPVNVSSPSGSGNAITLNNGSVLVTNNNDIFVTGDWIDNGATFNPGNATVTFNGTGTQAITGTASLSFYNLVFTNTGYTTLGTPILANNITISGTAALDVSASNHSITLTGDWTVTAPIGNPFIEQQGTVTFSGTVLQNISTVLAAGETFYNFIVNNTVNGVSLSSPINVSNNLTINNSGKFFGNAQTITLYGNWVNSGGTFTHNNNTVILNGSGPQTISKSTVETFYNLTSNSVGPITISGVAAGAINVNVNGTLTMNNGNFDLNSRILQLGSGVLATLVYNNGIMYNGYFRRYISSGTAISSTAGPLYGLFPVGTATDYRPVEINSTAPPTSSGTISVRHIEAANIVDVTYQDNELTDIFRVTESRSQIATASLAGGLYDVYVSMTGLAMSGNFADLRMETYTGPPYGVGTTQLADGLIQSPRVKRSGLSVAEMNNVFNVATKDIINTPLRQYYYSRRSGQWSDATVNDATWSYVSGGSGPSCDCIPLPTGYAVISSGHIVNVPSITNISYLTVEDGATLNGSANMTIYKDVTADGSGAINFTAGNFSVGQNMTLGGTGASALNGTFLVTGKLSIAAGASLQKNGTGAITLSGDLELDGTFNITAATTTRNGVDKIISGTGSILRTTGNMAITQNQTIATGSNLTIQPGITISSGKIVTNNGIVTAINNITGGAATSKWINANGSELHYAGATQVMNTGILDASAPNLVNYNRAGNQTVKRPLSTYYNLSLSVSGTKTFGSAGTITVSNLVTIQDAAIFNVASNTLDGAAGLIMTGTSNLQMQKLATTLPELTGAYNLTGGTITFNGAGAQNIRALNAVPSAYFNILVSNTGTKSLTGNTAIQNNFTLSTTAALDVTAGNFTMTLGGNWSVTSTNANPFIEQQGSVIFNGTALQTITTVLAGGETFYNLIISNPVEVQLMSNLNSNNLTINNGAVLNANTRAMNITGHWANLGGTFTPSSNTVTFNGALLQNISKPTAENFYNVVFDNTSTKLLACPIDVANNLTIAGTAVLDVSASNYFISVGNNWNVTSTNINPFEERSGTVTFNGSSAATSISTVLASGETFYNLIVNNTHASGLSFNKDITVLRDLTINSSAKLNNTSNKNIFVAGNWNNNGGSFVPGTGTVTFNGSSEQVITNTSGETFYRMETNTTGTLKLEASSDVFVTNMLTMTAGNYNLNTRTLSLGNGAANTLVRTSGIMYDGTFKRYIPATAVSSTVAPLYGLYPMGTATSFRPFEINSTVSPSAGGYIAVTHTDGTAPINVTYTDNEGSNIERITEMNTVVVVSGGLSGGTYNVNATFTDLVNMGQLTDIKMLTYTGSVMGSAGTTIATSGTVVSPKVGRSGLSVTDLSNVFVAGTINSTQTPLIQCYYTIADGNWNNPSIWSLTSGGPTCNCVPTTNGYAVVENHTANVNVASQINYIDITSGGILNGTANMIVNREVNVKNNGIFAPSSGNWTITNDFNLKGSGISSTSSGNTSVGRTLKVLTGNTLNLNGSLINSGDLFIDGTINVSTSNLHLNGAGKQISGTLGTGIVEGSGSLIISNNKTIGAGFALTVTSSVSLSANTIVTNNGNISVVNIIGSDATSKWENAANSTLTVSGTLLTTGTLDASANPNTVIYNADGNQGIKIPNPSYYNLTLTTQSGTPTGEKTYSAAGTITVNNSVSIINNAVFNVQSNRLSGAAGLSMTGNTELKFATYVDNFTPVPELTGTYSLTGGTITFNRAGNQILRGIDVTAAYNNLNIENSGTKSLFGNVSVQKDLTVKNTARLDASASNYTIKLAGNWNITSTDADPFVERGGTVTFNGATAQSISTVRPAGETFNTLAIANNGQTVRPSAGTNLTLSGKLDFATAGYLDIATNGNIITMNNWANGNVPNNGTDRFVIMNPETQQFFINGVNSGEICQFPVSISTSVNEYCRVDIANSDIANTSFALKVCNFVNLDGTCSGGTQVNAEGVNTTYDIQSASTNANVTLYWHISKEMTDFTRNDCQLNHHNPLVPKWDLIGSAGAATLFAGDVYFMSAPTTSFSPYGISKGGRALPVEFLTLDAKLVNDYVEIDWATLTEINNDYFTVERSKDGVLFEEITQVKGAGNSSVLLKYEAKDQNPLPGVSYYRIKQTDYDGKFKYSQTVSVNNFSSVGNNSSMIVFPNPVKSNQSINLLFTGIENETKVLVVLQDILGNVLFSKVIITSENNNSLVAFDTQQSIPPGIYIITGTSDNKIYNKRIVIK